MSLSCSKGSISTVYLHIYIDSMYGLGWVGARCIHNVIFSGKYYCIVCIGGDFPGTDT